MGIIKPILLTVDPSVTKAFSKLARKAFPDEALAYLIGTRCGKSVIVTELYPAKAAKTTPDAFFEAAESLPDAYLSAREDGLFIVGDIHSHPYKWSDWKDFTPYYVQELCWPSHFDWQGRQGHFWITGIVRVLEHKSGRKTCKTSFYGPLTGVKKR